MKFDMKADTKKFEKAVKEIQLTEKDMLLIEYTGSRVLVNRQRTLVPKKTTATQQSIDSHIIESSAVRVVDEIGPETTYAPYLEYGTSKMSPRPFVRSSAVEGFHEVQNVISTAFGNLLRSRWKI